MRANVQVGGFYDNGSMSALKPRGGIGMLDESYPIGAQHPFSFKPKRVAGRLGGKVVQFCLLLCADLGPCFYDDSSLFSVCRSESSRPRRKR